MPEDQTNDGDNANPNAETQTAEEAKAEVERLRAQLKGEQRTNERLRKDLRGRVTGEESTELIRVQGKKLDTVIEYLEKSGLNDPEFTQKLKTIKAESSQAESRLREETEATLKIEELVAETGVDFAEVGEAGAYWESGNYKKAVAVYERVAKGKQVPAGDDEKKVEAAKKVDAGGGTVATATGLDAKYRTKLTEADKIADPKARADARWAVVREYQKGQRP